MRLPAPAVDQALSWARRATNNLSERASEDNGESNASPLRVSSLVDDGASSASGVADLVHESRIREVLARQSLALVRESLRRDSVGDEQDRESHRRDSVGDDRELLARGSLALVRESLRRDSVGSELGVRTDAVQYL